VKAFLAIASSSNVCTSEILDSSTVRVRGRFDSNDTLRGPNFFSISAAVLKSFASTAVSIRATSSL